ncbi:uncharacterized protein LOC128851256 isoform X4 [Cuculus canorus]|uniref:uncharacterized protein LOC128851256 isoform X4 n=1 Tax=Cuculus canorus TaxID=55661 RepID=UPI0023AA8D59|nr:uncharacterized protein LOC128851256 isoform X4 [Cuculus canorus]
MEHLENIRDQRDNHPGVRRGGKRAGKETMGVSQWSQVHPRVGGGVPLGPGGPHCGHLPTLGCWRSRLLPACFMVLILDPSHHTSAPPGPKGPISTHVSAWPWWTHHGTHHLLLVLPSSSWHLSSLLGPGGHILAPIISRSCPTHLGTHHLFLAFVDTSWHPSPPGPAHLGTHHLFLAFVDTSWHPSSPPGPAQLILAPIISAWPWWTYLGTHHLQVLPNSSWHPSSLLGPGGHILAPIISSRSCPTQLGTQHLCLALLDPSWCPSSSSPSPILVSISSSHFHLDASHLLLLLLDPSWHPSSFPTGRILVPSSLLGPAEPTSSSPAPVLVPIISFSCIHLVVHQLLLLYPSWCQSSPSSPAPISVPIISSWSCSTHLGATISAWPCPNSSWHPSSPSSPAPILVPIIFSCAHFGASFLLLVLPKLILVPIISFFSCPNSSWCPSSPSPAPILVPSSPSGPPWAPSPPLLKLKPLLPHSGPPSAFSSMWGEAGPWGSPLGWAGGSPSTRTDLYRDFLIRAP